MLSCPFGTVSQAVEKPSLWSRLQPLLRTRLTAEEFEAWFAPLKAKAPRRGQLTLLAPSAVYAEYIRDHHGALLQELAAQLTGEATAVTVDVLEAAKVARPPLRTPLNPRYTFASFVPGPSNQFARAAAQSVAENPGRAYNPLFLYGGSGLGKTHLLHAIANEVLVHAPETRVRYVPTENFVNEFINSIRLQRMAQFRETHRSVELLLLDDVHILAGKEGTQEEFFHTFNALHEAGHQIVLTSDTSPAAIQGLEERLRSRFVWGLVADIQPPDLETKCAIIREKAHNEGFTFDDEVVLFIARRVRENVRELEGYLNRVIIYSTLTGIPPTVDSARSALSPVLPEERQVTPAEVIRFVAHHYGVKVADLKGRDNRRSVAFPRQVAMYLIREILNLSFPEIGKLFSKHHSTVMYSVESVSEQRRSNPAFDATLTTFMEHFR
jgi:chromosomal replication initiator protein